MPDISLIDTKSSILEGTAAVFMRSLLVHVDFQPETLVPP